MFSFLSSLLDRVSKYWIFCSSMIWAEIHLGSQVHRFLVSFYNFRYSIAWLISALAAFKHNLLFLILRQREKSSKYYLVCIL